MCRCDVDARFIDLRKQEASLTAAASSLAGLEATLSVLSATSSHASSGSGATSLAGQSTGGENHPLEVLSDLHNTGRGLRSEGNLKVWSYMIHATRCGINGTSIFRSDSLETCIHFLVLEGSDSTLFLCSLEGLSSRGGLHIDSCVQMAAEKGEQEVDRTALLKHAERVSAELAVVHAQLRERELTIEDAQQRAAAAMHSAQEADTAARAHRCGPWPA